MELIDIKQRVITLELNPEDALVIAQAFAYTELADDAAQYRTLNQGYGALFEALAVAAASHSYSDLPDDFGLAKVRQALGPASLTGGKP